MRNFMIFLFTLKSRLRMSYVFITLNVLQIIIGCLMSGGSIYICLSVTKYLYAEKAEIRFVFTVFAIFGTHIIVQYLIGIKMVERCVVKSHKKSTKRDLYLWLLVCTNTILDLVILGTMIIKISKHIIRSIRHSMEKGMRHYLTDPLWKHTMDRWQFSLKCCGVVDFRDWHSISWLDKYHINVDSPTVQSLLLSKDHLHLPVTPWSCCKLDYPMQCFHDPIQQMDSTQVWKEQPEIPELSLNHRGCLEAIRYPIEMALAVFLVLCIALLVLHIAIVIVSRLLYTSCRNAVILHDTSGKSPGWLFTRDCLADKRGRTLSEIIDDLEYESESEEYEGSDAFTMSSRVSFNDHGPPQRRSKKSSFIKRFSHFDIPRKSSVDKKDSSHAILSQRQSSHRRLSHRKSHRKSHSNAPRDSSPTGYERPSNRQSSRQRQSERQSTRQSIGPSQGQSQRYSLRQSQRPSQRQSQRPSQRQSQRPSQSHSMRQSRKTGSSRLNHFSLPYIRESVRPSSPSLPSGSTSRASSIIEKSDSRFSRLSSRQPEESAIWPPPSGNFDSGRESDNDTVSSATEAALMLR